MKLYNYQTGEFIRTATVSEALASEEAAKHDGGSGVIRLEINGVPTSCYVIGDFVWQVELMQHGTEAYTREYPNEAAALAAAKTEWQQNRSHPDFTAGGENRAVWRVYRSLPDGGRSDVTKFRADAR